MQSNVLNFPDAMILASLLSKYIDTESKLPDTPLDFIDDMLEKIDPNEYLSIVKLLTGKSIPEISKLAGDKLLEILFSGLEKNKILSLLDAYKTIGFV